MNKRIDYTKLGGLFFYQETAEFMQDSYYSSLNELAKFVGEKFIISGCAEGVGVVADGYMVVDGERMKFTGGANTGIVIVEEVVGQEGFDDGLLKDVFYTKTARFGNVGGFPYTDLKRLPLNAASIGECVTNLAKMVKDMIQFEPEVIMEGCEVTNVTTGPDEMDVSAGLVLFAGALVSTPVYSGAYPAYLKEDGGWVTAVPGAGLYITFDPYTSQRYINVLDRSLTPAGKINMYETLSDRFDAGVGRWEMKGFSLMSELQNRVALGLWFDGVPEANVSDAAHAADGNQGGEKKHILTVGELPTIPGTHGLVKENGVETATAWDNNAAEINIRTKQAWPGLGQEHENRQPFTVVVYAKRTA
jgi:hypothetical protein